MTDGNRNRGRKGAVISVLLAVIFLICLWVIPDAFKPAVVPPGTFGMAPHVSGMLSPGEP